MDQPFDNRLSWIASICSVILPVLADLVADVRERGGYISMPGGFAEFLSHIHGGSRLGVGV